MFTQLRRSKICHLTVNKMGIVGLMVQHDWIDSVNFMQYTGDFLRQTSVDIHSLKEGPIHIKQSWDFSCRMPQFILGNRRTALDRLVAYRETVGPPCNLWSYAAGIILSITYKLAANYSILTWCSLYIPQDFPLHFVIIFLSYSTPPKHGFTQTAARWWRIWCEPIDGRDIEYVNPCHTMRTHRQVSPPQGCQWSHQNYDPGCTFRNRP